MDAAQIIIRFRKENVEVKDKALVAYETSSGKILAIGQECDKYVELEGASVISPLEEGRIAEYTAALALFKQLIDRAYKAAGVKGFLKKSVMVCSPGMANEVDRKAILDCISKNLKTGDIWISDKSYSNALEQFELLNKTKVPNLVIEIVPEAVETIIENSISRVLKLAGQKGISDEEVIRIYNETLNNKKEP